VPRYDDEVIEALRRGRPRRQRINDAAEKKARKGGAAIPKGGGGRGRRVEGVEVEQDGEGEEEREEERAQVDRAGWGVESLEKERGRWLRMCPRRGKETGAGSIL
jgi:hypothetical protein